MLSRFFPASFGVLFCSVVPGSRYTPQTIGQQVVSDASFLTGGVFECDLAHRQFVAVLCMLYKIRCNQMHRLFWCSTLTVCIAVRVTQGAVVAHRYT